MKHLLARVILLVVVLVVLALTVVMAQTGNYEGVVTAAFADAPKAQGVNVKLSPGAAMVNGVNARPIFGPWYHIPDMEFQAAALTFSQAADIVEPNYTVSASDATATSYLEPTLLNQVNAPAAWGKATGQGVVIAIIDTGVNCAHSALTGHCSGDNDDNGHGTHVAGLAYGIAPGSSIRSYKALDSSGSGQLDAIAAAVTKAADQGARVANMSLGCVNCPSQLMQDAIAYANNHNMVVVAAAGNHGTDAPSTPGIYANLTVGAVDANDQLASFSAWGDWVTVAAPGVNLLSTCIDGSFCRKSGTSMATPVTSGVAALAASAHPTDGPGQLALRVRDGDVLHTLHPVGRRVNAANAVGAATPNPLPTPAPTPPPSTSNPNQRLLDLLNDQRQSNGLNRLPFSQALANAAHTHNVTMDTCAVTQAIGSCFLHQLPGEPDPIQRMRNAGWPYSGGENIGWGYLTVDDMVVGWMNSQGHRDNILNPNATAFGPDFFDGSNGGGNWKRFFYTLDVGIGGSPPGGSPTPVPAPTPTPSDAPHWDAGAAYRFQPFRLLGISMSNSQAATLIGTWARDRTQGWNNAGPGILYRDAKGNMTPDNGPAGAVTVDVVAGFLWTRDEDVQLTKLEHLVGRQAQWGTVAWR